MSQATEDPSEASSGGGAARARTVLVVDDDVSVLQVAAKVLRRDGYEVLEAGGGEEALRIAASRNGEVDLLLTDVVMPGMGGRELSERMSEEHADVPVLFMSAYTEDEMILRGVRVADVHFIQKPFTVAGLRAKVLEALGADPR